MNRMKSLLLAILSAAMLHAQANFDDLVDRYFNDQFRLNPTFGTASGFHQYDAQLEDSSAKANEERIRVDHQYLAEFQKLPQTDERDLVVSHIKGDLLELENIRPWEYNADSYSSGVTGSIFGLISRKFASPEDRLKSVISREQQIPQAFVDARKLLKNPPKIFTEVAIEQLPGIESFFQNDVPAAFDTVTDAKLLARFKKSNNAVIDSLKSYEGWLKTTLLPQSNGDFRIGADNYSKKVSYDEMVDVPLDRLLQIGYADLRRNQQELLALAKKIDPSKTPEQVADELAKDHPAPDQMLQTFRDTFNGLIKFIDTRQIIGIPSTVRPILEESPPFMRALTTASMDTPGPYEKVATEAYFNVTLPEKSWPAKEVEEYMTAMNRGTIISTAIHEAYPGHYVQLLWFQKVQSKVRKLIGCGSNIEGWAHYTEQMMLDEGYSDDPKIRFGQLIDALLRDCRYIVGIEMHTGKITYEQGIQFMIKEGYMTRTYAERETKRGTSDPTYLVYTLGKLEIMKLRDDYRAKQGLNFNLQDFHNRFMQQGGVPIKLIRHTMLGDDSPTL